MRGNLNNITDDYQIHYNLQGKQMEYINAGSSLVGISHS